MQKVPAQHWLQYLWVSYAPIRWRVASFYGLCVLAEGFTVVGFWFLTRASSSLIEGAPMSEVSQGFWLMIGSFCMMEIVFRSAHTLKSLLVPKAEQQVYEAEIRSLLSVNSDRHHSESPGAILHNMEHLREGVVYFMSSFPTEYAWIFGTFFASFVGIAINSGVLAEVMGVFFFLYLSFSWVMAKKIILPLQARVSQLESEAKGRMGDSLGNITIIESYSSAEQELLYNREALEHYAREKRRLGFWEVFRHHFAGLSIIAVVGISLTIMIQGYGAGEMSLQTLTFMLAVLPNMGRVFWSLTYSLQTTFSHVGSLTHALEKKASLEEGIMPGGRQREASLV